MNAGDLVKCGPWTLYPGMIGYVVEVIYNPAVGDCGDMWDWEYYVYVGGDIKKFIHGDFEVIDEKE